jgi:hypothetical protein
VSDSTTRHNLTLNETIRSRDSRKACKAGGNGRVEAFARAAHACVTNGSAFLGTTWTAVGEREAYFVLACVGTEICGGMRLHCDFDTSIGLIGARLHGSSVRDGDESDKYKDESE